MADISDSHAVLCLVNHIKHAPFLHHSCRVHAVVRPIQFLADPVEIVCQGAAVSRGESTTGLTWGPREGSTLS